MVAQNVAVGKRENGMVAQVVVATHDKHAFHGTALAHGVERVVVGTFKIILEVKEVGVVDTPASGTGKGGAE